MRQDAKGTSLKFAVEAAGKGAGLKLAYEKAIAALKKVDGVLDATHGCKGDDDEKPAAIDIVFDATKAVVLTALAKAAAVEAGERSIKLGAATIKIAGALYRKDEFWIFEEPSNLRAIISITNEEVVAKIAKIVGAEKVDGTITGSMEQQEAFEPSDPQRKIVTTKITVSEFVKKP